MKASILIIFLFLSTLFLDLNAQTSCVDLIEYVKSKSYGSTFYSYSSDAISQAAFYDVTDDNYNTFYFVVVRFTSSYTDYIYQVGSDTKTSYSMYYNDSAGKAFWTYIEPYSDVLDCGPDFD